jgi:hypothetical protein
MGASDGVRTVKSMIVKIKHMNLGLNKNISNNFGLLIIYMQEYSVCMPIMKQVWGNKEQENYINNIINNDIVNSKIAIVYGK